MNQKFEKTATGYQFRTTNEVYEIYFSGKRFNHTMLSCGIKVTRNDEPSLIGRIQKVNLFDDGDIANRSKTLAISTELSIKDVVKTLKEVGVRIEIDLLRTNESQEQEIVFQDEAEKLLKSKTLLKYISDTLDFQIVGETNNKILCYLNSISFVSLTPLHTIIQSDSSTGKSHMIHAIADLIPENDRKSLGVVTRSGFKGQRDGQLVRKLITIEDWAGLDKEAEYQLRELQTNKRLGVLSGERGGFRGSDEFVVEAHCSTLSATTKQRIFNENENRSFIIKLDDSDEQVERILAFASKKKAGLIDMEEYHQRRQLMHDMIGLLKPLEVVNPFATQIKIPKDCKDRTRLQTQVLGLVDMVTFLHQKQRKKDKEGRLISTVEDVELAVELVMDMLVNKADELTQKQRDFYESVKRFLQTKVSDESKVITEITFKSEDLIGYEDVDGSPQTIQRKLKQLVKEELLEIVNRGLNNQYSYQLKYNDEFELKKARIQEQVLSSLRNQKDLKQA